MTQIDVDVVLRARGSIERHHIGLVRSPAESVELSAKFLQQSGEILGVGRGRKFPINVEAVEQAGRGDPGRDVAVNKHIDTRRRQRRAALRGAGRGYKCRSIRIGCSPDRHQHLQLGVKLLELLNRREISEHRTTVSHAAHAGEIGTLIVSPGIGNRARRRRARGHVRERVKQVRQFVGDSILLQVRNVIAGIVDTPLFEISSENFFLAKSLLAK